MRYILMNFSLIALMGVMFSCDPKETDSDQENTSIKHEAINKEYVLIRDVAQLQQSIDEISLHVDSILNGLINVEFVSTGYKRFDLNGDEIPDIAFEIIDLLEFNPNGLPDSFDHLAARAVPLNLYLLDNSAYGYADALEEGELINNEGIWTNETVVLGTFQNAGQFQGQGERYLAYRFYGEQGYQYGWIQLQCSQHSDTLNVIDYAFKTNTEPTILAGQTE
jgi:hypothetical protein